jgi:hypothetical protein
VFKPLTNDWIKDAADLVIEETKANRDQIDKIEEENGRAS